MENNVNINVVDAMMGMGKTSAAINFMEENCESKRFIFITPYLDEGERIKASCQKCEFAAPPLFGNKQRGLKYLLRQKVNIVATHALFGLMDMETMELLSDGGYTLIMDEVFDAVSEYDVSNDDVNLLVASGLVAIDKMGLLTWTGEGDYAGAFDKLRKDMRSRSLVSVRAPPEENDNGAWRTELLLSVMPTTSFSCFNGIYVLTYLFEGSLLKSYFDLCGFSYDYVGVTRNGGRYEFCDTLSPTVVPGLSQKIDLWLPSRGSQAQVGNRRGSLSASWFKNHSRQSEQIVSLKKNIRNFYSNVTKARADKILWTTFKFAEKKLAGPGYARSFLSHNIRATNNYKDRWAVTYALNKYLNPGVVRFFQQNQVQVSEEHYALSTIIQFIWRSAIREGNPISLYIPSARMRELFQNWLTEVSG